VKGKMKIIIAPDSFKESMAAREVALIIEKGVKRVFPEARQNHKKKGYFSSGKKNIRLFWHIRR